MSRIWSEEGKLARWLDVELAALDGWVEIGSIPADDVAAIRAHATTPTPERVAEIEQTTDHDLAAFVDGAKVVTIEHQAADGKLSVIQEAFLESGATQCGFCTPGFVLMAGQLLEAHPMPDDDTIRHYLSGNLCRCAAYAEIVKAVKLAADKLQTGKA